MTKLVILDRDGVINFDSKDFIKSEDEWHPIPGSLEAIGRLKRAGFTVAIASNQSGVARGLYTEATLNKIHEKMQKALEIYGGKVDAIFYCPHLPEDYCDCRKPKPGLLERAAKQFGVNLSQPVPCIGDSLRDLEAALVAEARPILVLTGNGEETLNILPTNLKFVECFTTLASAVDALIAGEKLKA